MTKKAWIIFSIMCVAILGGLIWLNRSNNINVDAIDTMTVQEASSANGNISEHVVGTKTSKVTLIEYADYQCPGCQYASTVMEQVYEKYKDDVTLIFRNFPLYTTHPNAFAAATAAEAAGLQGKYWEMNKFLFENQNAWINLNGTQRTEYFVSATTDLDLDKDRFLTDMQSPEVRAKIDYDYALGKKDAVTGTPTFFLNGKKVDEMYVGSKIVPAGTENAQSVWTDFTAFDTLIIQPALKEAGITIAE